MRPREAGNEVGDFFARYDKNRDGVISYAEAQADPDLILVFERADANHDGVLDRREFDQAAILAARNRRAGAAAGWGGSAPPEVTPSER